MKPRFATAVAALLALSTAPALAAQAPSPAANAVPIPAVEGQRNTPPARTEIRIAVFGNDPCPKGQGDEIVVCARLPESERYRVPKRLRDEKAAAKRTEQAWGARVRDIDTVGNETLPSGCSAVGPGGTTGCFDQFLRDSRARKAADADAAAAATDVP
jgi:hypothetical protein